LEKNKTTVVAIWVDDLLLFADSGESVQETKTLWQKDTCTTDKWELTDTGMGNLNQGKPTKYWC